MKLLSLFDGSGGFPLAGAMCGIYVMQGIADVMKGEKSETD